MRSMIPVLGIVFLMLAFPSRICAQDENPAGSVFGDYLNPIGNPSFPGLQGLSFSSSAGFCYSSGGRNGSDGSGFYMGHFSCEFGSNLTLCWDVGLRSSMVGPEAGGNPEFFLPNVDLTYKPSDRFTMRLQFRQYGYAAQQYMMYR